MCGVGFEYNYRIDYRFRSRVISSGGIQPWNSFVPSKLSLNDDDYHEMQFIDIIVCNN